MEPTYTIEEMAELALGDRKARAAFAQDASTKLRILRRNGPWDYTTGGPLSTRHIYRIAPAPKYRPFSAAEASEIVGRVVRYKHRPGNHRMIVAAGPDFVVLGGLTDPVSLVSLFDYYEFIDGTPCGVQE